MRISLVAILIVVLVAGCVGQYDSGANETGVISPDEISEPSGQSETQPSVQAVCGDGTCDDGESDCCVDCGCLSGECINGACAESVSLMLIDNKTQCSLDGVAYPASEEYYWELPTNTSGGRVVFPNMENMTYVLLNSTLSDCFGAYAGFNVQRNGLIIGDEAIFNVNPQYPNADEYPNFIRPQDVGWYVDENKKYMHDSMSVSDKLREWFRIIQGGVQYIGFFSRQSEWYTPNMTLNRHEGDCEEFSTTFLSVVKAYDPSLNCFNLVVPEHVTTVCKFEKADYDGVYQNFMFVDQGDTWIQTNFLETSDEKEYKLRTLFNNYFDTYGLTKDLKYDLYVYYAFNQTLVRDFESDSELFSWLISV